MKTILCLLLSALSAFAQTPQPVPVEPERPLGVPTESIPIEAEVEDGEIGDRVEVYQADSIRVSGSISGSSGISAAANAPLFAEYGYSYGSGAAGVSPLVFPGHILIGIHPDSGGNFTIDLGEYGPSRVGVETIVDSSVTGFNAIADYLEDSSNDFFGINFIPFGGLVYTYEHALMDQAVPRNVVAFGFVADVISVTPSPIYSNFWNYRIDYRFRFYGTGADPDGQVPLETPEPTSICLLLVGSIAFVSRRRRTQSG